MWLETENFLSTFWFLIKTVPMLAATFFFLVGACVGSFLNVLIYRVPRRMSIIRPPSMCPVCKTKIKWYHNIPIFSYVFLRGRCAYCGVKIPIRYFLVELGSAFVFLLAYLSL